MAAGPIRISILADSRDALSGINRTASSVEGLGSRITRRLGPALATGFAVVGAAAVKMGYDAVQAASDLEETLNKTNVVFGKNSRSIIKWSETAVDRFGLTQQEALSAVSYFGEMASQMGSTGKEAVSFSKDIVSLATDLGSFHNLETNEVLDMISASMRGEYDSLQRLVPSINAAAVETKALSQTGKDSADALTAQEKATATLALITDKSKNAIGDFRRTNDSFANSTKKLNARIGDLEAEIGQALLPVAEDLVHWADREMVPALEKNLVPAIQDATRWFSQNRSEIVQTAQAWGDNLVTALDATWDILGPVLDTLNDLPDPVKEVIIQVGVLSTALSKMNSAAGLFGADMALVGKSAEDANKKVGVLATGASKLQKLLRGGLFVGMGAMVADSFLPDEGVARATFDNLGRVVSMFGQGVTGQWDKIGQTWDDMQAEWDQAINGYETDAITATEATAKWKAAVDNLAYSLDALNGQPTGETYIQALEELEGQLPNVVEAMNELGVSQRTVAMAAAGDVTALRQVRNALDSAKFGMITLKDGTVVSAHAITDALSNVNMKTREAARETRQAARITQDWSGKLKNFPKEARTEIRLDGVNPTIKGIVKVTRRYDLTPKQIRTLLEVTGVDASVKQIRNVVKELDRTAKKRTEARVEVETRDAERQTQTIRDWMDDLTGTTAKPKATLEDKPARDAVSSLERLLGGIDAKTVSPSVNVPVPLGDIASVNNALNRIPDEYVTIHVTWDVPPRPGGGGGNERPVRDRPQLLRGTGGSEITQILQGIENGTEAINNAWERLVKYIEKTVNLKNNKKEAQREKRILQALKDEIKAIRDKGRELDRIQTKLERQAEKVQEIRGWINDIKTGMQGYVSAMNFGQLEDGSVNLQLMLDQMEQAERDAQRWANVIETLSSSGLNQTTIDQLLQQGVASLPWAEAIASGGQAAIDQLNSTVKEINQVGQQFGSDMSDVFFDQGLTAAQGVLEGLERQEARLKKKMRELGRELARELRELLGRGGKGNGGKNRLGWQAVDTYRSTNAGREQTSLRITLTAEQLSQLQRGKQIQADLDAWRREGGRSRA